MKKMIRRVRKGQAPPVPASLSELTIEGEWTQTSGPTPEPFLIYDNGQNSDSRIVVFASPPALRTLSTADTWFMDGNFTMAPPGFLQLYVIRVPLGSTTVGIAYALLQRKTHMRNSSVPCWISAALWNCIRIPGPLWLILSRLLSVPLEQPWTMMSKSGAASTI